MNTQMPTNRESGQEESRTNSSQAISIDASKLVCSHCGRCKSRCEVLSTPDLDIGAIRQAYDDICELDGDELVSAVQELLGENYAMYHALRQCCFCGHCTSACDRHIAAPEVMRAWREIFSKVGILNPNDSKLVMVDNEWHIFSAYRAIYGISYPESTSLSSAAEHGPGLVDTLFFPGCSLVSYAPEVIKQICAWLKDAGINFALSDGCCGSPLMSAGLFERAYALRESFIQQMCEAGITRMITVCPGCADEFRPYLPQDIELVTLPEIILETLDSRSANGIDTGLAPMDLGDITFFDSCHDRHDLRNANAIRAIFSKYVSESNQIEMKHAKSDTLCCGAGGAVSSYDPAITDERVWRVIDEGRATGANTLITMCPTCTYTIAQASLANPDRSMNNLHYLEALFGVKIDWDLVFAQLGSMWTGEYGPWLNQTFFS